VSKVRLGLVVAIAGLCLAAFIGGTAVTPPYPPLPVDPFWLVWAGFPVVGSLILTRRPGNHVGQLQLLIGVCAAVSAVTSILYALGADPTVPALINQLAFAPIFMLVPLLILIFPSGDLPSPRWLPYAKSAVVTTVLLTFWLAIRPVSYSFDNVSFYENPLGVEALATLDSWVMGLFRLALGIFAVAALVQAVARFRQADVIGRLQVKWVLVPALFMPIVFVIGGLLEGLDRDLSNIVAITGILLGGNGVAAGIGIAVFRHRLYGIDKIVSRTVTYSVLVAFLGLSFFALVTASSIFVTGDDPRVIAIATLAAAALFNPARKRVLRAVEKRFNRSTYHAEMVVEQFSGSLKDRVDPEVVLEDWVATVNDAMQPSKSTVWVRKGSR
jgi:hypothetical protein